MKILGIHSSPRIQGSHSLYESLSAVMLQGLFDEIRAIESSARLEIVHLHRHRIEPCRGCFSDLETRCHYLCDCYDDDFTMLAEKIIDSQGVIFATPTYMFGMSSTLKRFFERWISFKAPPVPRAEADKSLEECFKIHEQLIEGRLQLTNPLQGKVGAIVVSGSELGQDAIVREIMLILNLYGFLLPPQCFIYHTGHSMQSLEDVRISFYENQWLAAATKNLARSMVQLIRLVAGHSWPQMSKLIQKL